MECKRLKEPEAVLLCTGATCWESSGTALTAGCLGLLGVDLDWGQSSGLTLSPGFARPASERVVL